MGPSPIDSAKARHSLAEVAARTGIYVPDHGRSVSVRCPMPAHGHFDRTPSMRLHLDTGIWCCFACSPAKSGGGLQGGDVIDWVRQTEQVSSWREAIHILDSRRPLSNAWSSGHAGAAPVRGVGQTELPDLGRSSAREVQQAVIAAWDYYTAAPRHERGRLYLAARRIDIRLLERFNGRAEVGHTPAHPVGLVNYLRSRGFSDHLLVDAALAHRRVGQAGLTDFYRERVLIPVRDCLGAVVGMVGRNVGDNRWPKYKNPPRTAIYDKSVNLYGPFRTSVQRRGRIVVVEGTIDAIAIACAALDRGVQARVCPITQSGKELSAVQVRAVAGRCRSPVLIAFDGDTAGRASTRRLQAAIRRLGYNSSALTFPCDSDPASWFAKRGSAGIEVFLAKGEDDCTCGREGSTQAARRVNQPSLP